MHFKEEWVDVKGYEGIYQVSDKGNVRSLPKHIIRSNGRKQTFKGRELIKINHNGYLKVHLTHKGIGGNVLKMHM
ncbi:hypothetical protein PSYJYH_000023 [Bacillus phage PSYJ-YH]|nr:hypothetical protein PSYJYH_000023 [Bacillus phage PSYJ-YH]